MIAIVYPQFGGVGGISRYLDSLLTNLPAATGSQVLLVTGTWEGARRSYPGVEVINVPLPANRLGLFIWGLRVRRLLRQLYRAGRLQRVNFHFPPLIPGLLLPAEIPMVLTAHTTYLGMSGRFYSPPQYLSPWSPLSLAIKLWMERRILAKACKVITLTEQGREEIRRYHFPGPVAILPNGADATRFTPDGSAAKTYDVLFCGRIERRKGSEPMISLCQMLIELRPGIRIAIVGYGDEEALVRRRLAPYTNNIHLAGKTPFEAMIGFYNASRVYVSTSYYEGLPGTCLEAMAMCLPVVAWDFLFYRGLVTPGETGYLLPPNDLPAMAGSVLQLLDNPAAGAAMGRRARELLLARYDWHDLAPQVLTELSAELSAELAADGSARLS